jgi:fucose permease
MNETLDSIKILGNSLLIWFPSFGMMLGYILGVICIPKFMSQETALKLCSTIGAIGSLGIILFPAMAPWLLLVVAFGCSMGAPAIWPLSLKDLGKFTKNGSALLTMGIAGGAVFPPLFGLLASAYSAQVGYWLCLPCFLFILYFAVAGHKIRTK